MSSPTPLSVPAASPQTHTRRASQNTTPLPSSTNGSPSSHPPSSSPSASSTAAASPSKAAASYVFDELDRISNAVSQPGSLSSFQQLRRTLGDDAAFVVMDYFIDIRTLHDYCTELKASSSDRHAAVLTALLLRSELAEPVRIVQPGRDEARAAQLIAACQVSFTDVLSVSPELKSATAWAMQWPADTHGMCFDCLLHNLYPDPRVRNDHKVEKLFFNGDMMPLPLFVVLGRKKLTMPSTPIPMNAAKLAMFGCMARAYFYLWRIPPSVWRQVDLDNIYRTVAFMPPMLRQAMAAQDRHMLLDVGIC